MRSSRSGSTGLKVSRAARYAATRWPAVGFGNQASALTRLALDSPFFRCGNQAQRYMCTDIQMVCRNSKDAARAFLGTLPAVQPDLGVPKGPFRIHAGLFPWPCLVPGAAVTRLVCGLRPFAPSGLRNEVERQRRAGRRDARAAWSAQAGGPTCLTLRSSERLHLHQQWSL